MRTLKLDAEPSEADVQRLLIKRLSAAGWLVVRVNGGGFKTPNGFFRSYLIPDLRDDRGRAACSGFPDLLCLRAAPDGGIEARLFELKKKGEKPSPSQARFHDFAARHGIEVEIVEGLAGLEKATAKYFVDSF